MPTSLTLRRSASSLNSGTNGVSLSTVYGSPLSEPGSSELSLTTASIDDGFALSFAAMSCASCAAASFVRFFARASMCP